MRRSAGRSSAWARRSRGSCSARTRPPREITAQSRSEAEDRLEAARREAAQIVSGAEERVRELDAETDRIWAERHRIVEDTRELARELLAITDSAAEPVPGRGRPSQRPEGEASRAADRQSLRRPSSTRARIEAPSEDEVDGRGHFAEEPDPDVEPTAILPVVEPAQDEPSEADETALVGSRRASPDAADRRHAPRPPARDRGVAGRRRGDRPGPDVVPARRCSQGLDGERPRALLLTHIHLDHAGASGSLVERWPDLEVYVHERGARHMADPRAADQERRGCSTARTWTGCWGEMVPVPEGNLRVLHGGERLFDGAFEVAYTPGHASHHVSYLHDGTAFVGDTGGVRIASSSLTVPPSPPPDIDVEAWHDSIERIAAWKPEPARA